MQVARREKGTGKSSDQWVVAMSVKQQMQHHVLMYHHVAPIAGRAALLPYLVTPETFRKQLDAIAVSGLPVLTMKQLVHDYDNGQSPKRSVVLTFDDCSRELWDVAIPELEQRGLKASFYAVSSRFGGQNDWDDHRGAPRVELMIADELRTLAEMGHEVGSHGVHHQRLDQLAHADVVNELVQSKQVIEAVTGILVETLAYPFGAIPERHDQVCADAGYRAACSIFSRDRTVLQDRYAVRRILAHEGDTGLRFRFKLSRPYLWLRGRRDPGLIAKSAARDHRQKARTACHD